MNHWDEKYQEEQYIYGKEANAYVKSIFKDTTDLPKKIVLFAEGEGRNAVYLAELGYDVTTYDTSNVGIEKQRRLATEKHVQIKPLYGDITEANVIPYNTFDYSMNIFGHVPSEGKQMMFHNLVNALVSGGHSYFEFYAKNNFKWAQVVLKM